jgi:hypothetical protein
MSLEQSFPVDTFLLINFLRTLRDLESVPAAPLVILRRICDCCPIEG